MKKSKLFVFSVAIFLFSCLQDDFKTPTSNLDLILSNFHDSTSTKVLIAAHRAMHTMYPENSLAAFQHAIDSGVDIIETDIRMTKDGKLILMHDNTIDRTSKGSGKVNELTFAELENLGLRKDSDDTKEHKIPLAEEALILARGKVMVDLDIKGVYVKSLVDLVHKTKTEKQVIFFDSEFEILDSVKILDPTLMIMPRAYSIEDVRKIIDKYHPPVIHIDPSFYTEEVVNLIKSSGAKVWINALGFADAKALIGLVDTGYAPLVDGGANIIQTDNPLILHKYLTNRKLK